MSLFSAWRNRGKNPSWNGGTLSSLINSEQLLDFPFDCRTAREYARMAGYEKALESTTMASYFPTSNSIPSPAPAPGDFTLGRT